MAPIRSPLAPEKFPGLPPLAGVRLATGACEIRYKARSDVCLIELAPGSAMAGVFTRSLTAAAPVLWCRKALTGRRARAVVINSGNANAFTGSVGAEAVGRTVEATAGLFGCAKREKARARARRLAGGGRGNYDHGHLSQGRDPASGDRRPDRDAQRHR
jgi:glutamate N-acetyltransferase/amino-acid N-acetyltransferase